jgi:2-polyprenyl-3-methyl-5-hydroxy-6-metoxy-1,4-benzoquinol methylase
MGEELEFTGERFIPGTAGEIWHEHWHRYHFAAPLVSGLDVLDVACGEGYGSALLASRATKVIGADIAPAAVGHAAVCRCELRCSCLVRDDRAHCGSGGIPRRD